MKVDNSENMKRQEKRDPDANPLISFGRDDDFTDELIKGICRKNETKGEAPKTATIQSTNQNLEPGLNGYKTLRKRQSTGKKVEASLE